MQGGAGGLAGAQDDARLRALLRELGHRLAHDLGGPARKAEAFAGMLAQDLGPDLSADAAESLACLRTSVEEVQRGLERLARWARLPEGPGLVRAVSLAELLEGVRQRRPELSWQGTQPPGSLSGNPQLLGLALEELLANAAAYAPAEPPQVRAVDGHLEVLDHGPGLRPEQLAQATEPLRRFVGADHSPGAGLGLAIARRIAELHGGRLELVAASPGLSSPGLVARLRLP